MNNKKKKKLVEVNRQDKIGDNLKMETTNDIKVQSNY